MAAAAFKREYLPGNDRYEEARETLNNDAFHQWLLARQAMTPKQFDCWHLRFCRSWTQDQIARHLHITQASVHYRLVLAEENLRLAEAEEREGPTITGIVLKRWGYYQMTPDRTLLGCIFRLRDRLLGKKAQEAKENNEDLD